MNESSGEHKLPTVHITGNGSIKRDATYAVITLNVYVETRHRDDDNANAANTESTDRVALATTSLRRAIEPYIGKDVISWKTTGLHTSRMTRWEPQHDGPSQKFEVASARISVTVSCKPVDGVYAGLNSIARHAMTLRDVSVNGVRWSLDGKARRAAELEARAAAAQDAHEQAQVYARAIWSKPAGQGIRCVRLEQPVHGGGGVRRQRMASAEEEESDEDLGGFDTMGADKPPLELEPEQTHFSATIQTIWEVDA